MSKVTMSCPQCGRIYTPDLCSDEHFDAKYDAWKNGALVQKVWPQAKPYQREQLQTGLCSDECFQEFCGSEEEWEG